MGEKLVLCLATMVCVAGVVVAASAPVAVSPGDASKLTMIEDICPTFSWGGVEGAGGYEIVVYRLGDENQPREPVLLQTIAGTALGWTPSLDRCMERGGRYAWSVRAVGQEEASEWSAPSLFEVAAGPSEADFEEAVDVVRRYLAVEIATDRQNTGSHAWVGVHEASEQQTQASAASRRDGVRSQSAAFEMGIPTAQVTVEGEVRTIGTDGEPRLWGRGRIGTGVFGKFTVDGSRPCTNGSISFGLSDSVVGWGSAADACPSGTWVCGQTDIVPCNTNRPDTDLDGYDCDGSWLDWDSAQHLGWLADWGSGNAAAGAFCRREDLANSLVSGPCNSYPVWCCW